MKQIQSQYDLPLQKLQEQFQSHNWTDIPTTSLDKAEPSYLPVNTFYTFLPKTEYNKYYQILYWILEKQEHSQRSYCLTRLMLKICTNNFYALLLHKKIFYQQHDHSQTNNQSILNNILKELNFINNLLDDNGKEYQLWVYKKQLIERYSCKIQKVLQMKIYEEEDYFIEYLLKQDRKNYHAWDYKFWLVRFYKKEEEEIRRTEEVLLGRGITEGERQAKIKLEKEINSINISSDNQYKAVIVDQNKQFKQCYSLWSYRFNLIKEHILSHQKIEETLQKQYFLRELQNILRCVQINEQDQQNQCIWNYFLGFICEYFQRFISHVMIKRIIILLQKINGIQKGSQIQFNRYSYNMELNLLIFLEERNWNQLEKIKQRKREIITIMQKKDPVRILYYNYLLQKQGKKQGEE